MRWFRRKERGRHEPGGPEAQVAVERSTFGAAAVPRFDSGGRPIVDFTPQIREALGLDGSRTGLAEMYRSQPNVRICVDFLATNIAHCKLKVYRKRPSGEREEVEESHPLVQLLANPNGYCSGYEFMRDTMADLAIYGNAFWVRRNAGDQTALVRVHPIYVSIRGGSPVTGPDFYEVDVGGGPVRVNLDEMVHFHEYNPTDVRVGVSVLESLRYILAEERATQKHRLKFWRNAARIEGWIKRPKSAGPWTPEQRKEFRTDWTNAFTGEDNAGRTAVLEDDMEWMNGSFSPRDSEFIEGREFGLDLCATTFQIPLAALSRTKTATYASIKEFHTIVYVDTLGPRMAELEKAINIQLVPFFRVFDRKDQGLFVEFFIDEKLQGDFESEATAAAKALGVPHMSVNEYRKKKNLPRIVDPDYDKPAKPSNYTYGSATPPPNVVRPQLVPGEEAALHTDLLLELEQLEETNGHHA